MKISVKVKTKAKEQRIEKIEENVFAVWVKEPAQKGKANAAVIKVVAKHFKTAQSNVHLVAGLASSQKIVVIKI
ncbi:MAG: DUF167 family protein [Candidatus Gribaldobacteria bacterium]|nr:DUF167 family protein [Candidatus Gribaldobacteria bacterium]